MVRKAEQEAAKARQAREEMDKFYAEGGPVPISSVSPSVVPTEVVSGSSEKVSSSFSRGIYVPGRRMKRMAQRRHITIRRSVRLDGKRTASQGDSSKEMNLKADDAAFILKGSSTTFPEGSYSVLTK